MSHSNGPGGNSFRAYAVERRQPSRASVTCYPEFTVALPRPQECEETGSPMIGVMDCRPQHLGQSWAGVPSELLEFFDRPLLQHAVEQMVQNGVNRCIFIAEDASDVMKHWGTGERWGCAFSVISPNDVPDFLSSLPDAPLLIGVGNCIPSIGATISATSPLQTQLFFAYVEREAIKARLFTGWAIARPQTLIEQRFAAVGAFGLLDAGGAIDVDVLSCIHSGTPADFLSSQTACLDAMETDRIFHGMELRPGLWAARNVFIDPGVKSSGKIYLGENVRIAKGVTLAGPLVICRDSVIDTETFIAESSVQPHTYVGSNMELQQDIVSAGAIVHARSGKRIEIADPRKLASTRLTLWSYLKSLFKGTSQKAA